MGGTLSNWSLYNKILWSILWKVLEKSIKQERTTVLGASVAASHWWMKWTRACIVEVFFTQPIWKGSMCGITTAASQSKTKASSTLLRTAVREMGLMSLSIECGWGTLPRGRTLAHFQRRNVPWLIEELNIEHTGRHNIGAKFFRTQLGISSGPHDLRSLMASSEC